MWKILYQCNSCYCLNLPILQRMLMKAHKTPATDFNILYPVLKSKNFTDQIRTIGRGHSLGRRKGVNTEEGRKIIKGNCSDV